MTYGIRFVFFFFFKQKTAYEMRISDWSSDVCSSDLTAKILIVEDDMHIRRLLRATMQRAGHTVVEAADARQAIALLDIERPDIVLLDLGQIGREAGRERVCQYV